MTPTSLESELAALLPNVPGEDVAWLARTTLERLLELAPQLRAAHMLLWLRQQPGAAFNRRAQTALAGLKLSGSSWPGERTPGQDRAAQQETLRLLTAELEQIWQGHQLTRALSELYPSGPVRQVVTTLTLVRALGSGQGSGQGTEAGLVQAGCLHCGGDTLWVRGNSWTVDPRLEDQDAETGELPGPRLALLPDWDQVAGASQPLQATERELAALAELWASEDGPWAMASCNGCAEAGPLISFLVPA